MTLMCTWSVTPVSKVTPLKLGGEFFISEEHSLSLLGTIHVWPTTCTDRRRRGTRAWKFKLQVGECCTG